MTHPTDSVVRARGLTRRFGDLVAVDGIDFDVGHARCLGLLGPNGAGKTTTIEMLEGLSPPDAGEIRVLGLDWTTRGREIRHRIGVQLQETQHQDKLTVFETLRLFRSFYDRGATEGEIIDLVGLGEKRDTRVVHLSGGQRQRLSLGCALVNRPDVLFLDEPSTGLDPQARRRVWDIVEDFKAAGGSVLLTTHYMEEAERLADDLVILDHGRIIAEGSPSDIIAGLEAESIVEFRVVNPEHMGRLSTDDMTALDGVDNVKIETEHVTLSVADTAVAVAAVLHHVRDKGVDIDDLRTHRPTLDDVFLSLTGKQLRDE